MELAEGVILDGHYRLRQLLGRGGMGEVWEAEHTRLPKQLAIKFLHGLDRANPELLMRFRREAEIASRLSHPSIVQVTDFNTLADGTAYIAMERLIGEDLRARLQRGALPLGEAREITRQVASALALAHEAGIVHRDLKPENIFLCREPDGMLRAKLLDFGISKLQQSASLHASTRDDRVLGTPGYMAPEQALGKNSSIDGRTDLFALATIVYEMLTGQSVFRGDTLAELCTKVLYHTPPPLDEVLAEVPRSLAVAVSQALSKDPSQRQREIRAFADEVIRDAVATVAPQQPSSAALGYSPTLASDPSATPSLARALAAAAPQAAPAPLSDAVTRSARPSERASSKPTRQVPRRLLGAGAALLLLGGGALVWLKSEPTPSATPLHPPRATVMPGPPSTENAPASAAHDQSAAAVATSAPSDAAVQGASARAMEEKTLRAPEDPRARNVTRAQPSTAEVPLSSAVRATLDDADRALQRGQSAEAIRLARGSLREAQSERAYVIMARAYCALHDVGMLQAMLRNLSPARRKQVQRECPQ
jgi:eukaryotic-like serine/threonine-protein kinase